MNLRSAWSDLFAIGDNGTILHNTWQPQTGSLNRLLQECRKTSAGKTIYSIEYTFDDNSSKNGNIHKVVYDGKHVTEFTYNEMNELIGIAHPDSSTETLTYDNNGNLTQTTNNTTGETTTYEWDCFCSLAKVVLSDREESDISSVLVFFIRLEACPTNFTSIITPNNISFLAGIFRFFTNTCRNFLSGSA